VHQVLTDYQSRANGGDGWLRYYTFKPAENKIYAYTYSPTRNGGAGEFERDASSEFVLDYAMQGTPFTVIATNPGVASGATTTATWSGLASGTEYEWYVTANDGTATTTGPVWSFTASSGPNSPPVAVDDAYVVSEDGILTVPGAGVIANDTDPDDNGLTAVLLQASTQGTLVLNPNGTFTYTPAANFHGVDSFSYLVSDGAVLSAPATVTITITPVNDAPVAVNDAATTTEETAVSGSVLVNDTDVDAGTTLTATLGATPTNGIVTLAAGGSFTYTPNANFNGTDRFT
jgi:VCBS repeat-containing protein